MNIFRDVVSKKHAGRILGDRSVGVRSMQDSIKLADDVEWMVARIRNAVVSAGGVFEA